MASSPPQPLPDQLWGDRWRFATLPAANVLPAFQNQPIPIVDMPERFHPVTLGIASTTAVPGVVIDGGRQSLVLARWLQTVQPIAIRYVAGELGGLLMDVANGDRWILATFADSDVAIAGQQFEQRKQASKGLHFLLVQPDDTGVTYSGIWLLQSS